MSTLESYTKDNIMPRTDHVIPAAHVLDENASPDPQPIPTMVNNYNCMDIGINIRAFTVIMFPTRRQDHRNIVMAHCVSVYWIMRGVAPCSRPVGKKGLLH